MYTLIPHPHEFLVVTCLHTSLPFANSEADIMLVELTSLFIRLQSQLDRILPRLLTTSVFEQHTSMPTPDTNTNTNTITPLNVSFSSSPHRSQKEPQTLPQSIRIRNRRKRYLEAHPSYFGASLESAGMYQLINASQSFYLSAPTYNLCGHHLTRHCAIRELFDCKLMATHPQILSSTTV